MLTIPLVAPNPALMETLPPNPPVPDSAPAVRFNAPPVPPVPDSNPPVRLIAPPFPVVALAGWREREAPAAKVVMSDERLPAKASCPAVERAILEPIN